MIVEIKSTLNKIEEICSRLCKVMTVSRLGTLLSKAKINISISRRAKPLRELSKSALLIVICREIDTIMYRLIQK